MTTEPTNPERAAVGDTPVPDENHPAGYPASPEEDAALPSNMDAGTTRALTRLLRLSPFLSLHRAYGGDLKWRRRLCFTLDCIVRAVVVSLILAILFAVAWKTLIPLPPWHPQP